MLASKAKTVLGDLNAIVVGQTVLHTKGRPETKGQNGGLEAGVAKHSVIHGGGFVLWLTHEDSFACRLARNLVTPRGERKLFVHCGFADFLPPEAFVFDDRDVSLNLDEAREAQAVSQVVRWCTQP